MLPYGAIAQCGIWRSGAQQPGLGSPEVMRMLGKVAWVMYASYARRLLGRINRYEKAASILGMNDHHEKIVWVSKWGKLQRRWSHHKVETLLRSWWWWWDGRRWQGTSGVSWLTLSLFLGLIRGFCCLQVRGSSSTNDVGRDIGWLYSTEIVQKSPELNGTRPLSALAPRAVQRVETQQG